MFSDLLFFLNEIKIFLIVEVRILSEQSYAAEQLQENTFTSAIIEVGTEQKVISTGPYAIVRHPMYIGALIMLLGVPLALGSWWGLFTIIPITIVIVWRLLDEEKFLVKTLPDYSEYRNKVRHRLVPFIW